MFKVSTVVEDNPAEALLVFIYIACSTSTLLVGPGNLFSWMSLIKQIKKAGW